MVMTQPVDPTSLEAIVNVHAAAKINYDDLEKWWGGDQKVILTDRLKQFLLTMQPANVHFSDNYLEVVVAAVTDRLNVTGFAVPGEHGEIDDDGNEAPGPLAQFAVDTWTLERGDALQLRVHDTTVALGDAFVTAEWDPTLGRVALHYNDPRLVRVHYNPSNVLQPQFASKMWEIAMTRGTSVRLNVYHPDRIERWIRSGSVAGGIWRAYVDDDFGGVIPWVMPDGEPIGLPVVHFSNAPRGQTCYGRSEMLPAIPLQRALNKALHDLVRTSDAQGWPQRWATGTAGGTGDLNASPGDVWVAEEEGAKFGQLEAASPEGVIAVMNKAQEDIGAITQTPQHLFRVTSGGFPSGEALKTAEAPLVRKVGKRQVQLGNSWEDVMALAARIAAANGVLDADLPPSGYSAQWESAESRPTELDHVLAVNAKPISRRQRLREFGYDAEQIARIEQEIADEPAPLAEALGRAFDSGGPA